MGFRNYKETASKTMSCANCHRVICEGDDCWYRLLGEGYALHMFSSHELTPFCSASCCDEYYVNKKAAKENSITGKIAKKAKTAAKDAAKRSGKAALRELKSVVTGEHVGNTPRIPSFTDEELESPVSVLCTSISSRMVAGSCANCGAPLEEAESVLMPNVQSIDKKHPAVKDKSIRSALFCSLECAQEMITGKYPGAYVTDDITLFEQRNAFAKQKAGKFSLYASSMANQEKIESAMNAAQSKLTGSIEGFYSNVADKTNALVQKVGGENVARLLGKFTNK